MQLPRLDQLIDKPSFQEMEKRLRTKTCFSETPRKREALRAKPLLRRMAQERLLTLQRQALQAHAAIAALVTRGRCKQAPTERFLLTENSLRDSLPPERVVGRHY